MAEYKVVNDRIPELVRFTLVELEWATQHERPLIANWAQRVLDDAVSVGVLVPHVWWAVRDTRAGTFAAENIPSKPAALAKRRELGGNSARYRVEPVHPVAPPEEP